MNHYIVSTKCGHVGRKNFIVIDFAIKAESKSDAARIARSLPRVKRHHKDAILDVQSVDINQWREAKYKNLKDPYLSSHSKQEQLATCLDIEDRVIESTSSLELEKPSIKANYVYKAKKNRYEKNKANYLIKEFYQSPEYHAGA